MKRKPKDAAAPKENSVVESEAEKPMRRGRSSGGKAEFIGMAETVQAGKEAKTVQAEEMIPKKRGRPTANQVDELAEEPIVLKRLSRLLAAQIEEVVEEKRLNEALPKKRGRPAVVQADELAREEDAKSIVPKRRGRTSVGRVEDQPDELVDEVPRETAPKKKAHHTATSSVEQLKEGSPKVPEKLGRPSVSQPDQLALFTAIPVMQVQKPSKNRVRPAAVETAADVAAEELDTKKRRKRMSDVEILEQQSANFADTTTPIRGRTRTRPSDVTKSEPSNPKGQERGKKRTRQSNVQTEVIDGPSSSKMERKDKGKRSTGRSGAELDEGIPQPLAKGASKAIKPSRRSEVIEVEVASSKLTKGRGDKRAKPSANAALKAASKASINSSAPLVSSKPKKGGQSSKASVVQRTDSAPFQARSKSSKQPSQAEAPSRKRKRVESK